MKKEIYLAGGCFWGTEKYLGSIYGVLSTEAGYANGNTKKTTYEKVCYQNSGHAETVKVVYDEHKVSLPHLLELFYEAIDPVSINRQGNDAGTQYRTGIYFVDKRDEAIIHNSLHQLQNKHKEKIAIEAMPLRNYCPAEKHHQKYLDKNPGGYCHISARQFEKVREAAAVSRRYRKATIEELRKKLTAIQFTVTQLNSTEPAFRNEYFDQFRAGIYTDITTGQPLFSSSDKFASNCGWPSFSRPIEADVLTRITDRSHGIMRTEVRSRIGNAHLGHVYDDGPLSRGGLHYCINSAALQFVSRDMMKAEGYGEYLRLL